jgi:transcriptional regulator with XRE-family HTH domain
MIPDNWYKMKGSKLQEIRFKKGLTQAKLAQMLGVTITTISKMENGKQDIKPIFAKYLHSLGYDVGYGEKDDE